MSRRLGLVRITLAAFLCGGLACSYVDDDKDLTLPIASGSLTMLASEPPAGAVDVARNTSIDLFFDQPLAAETLRSFDVGLFSGRVGILGSLEVDLLSKRLRFTPDGPLRPDLEYQVLVSAGLRGLDGAALAESVSFGFVTGRTVREPEAPRPVPSASEIQLIWQQNQCLSCHSPPNPVAGVDLSTSTATLRTLRNVTSLAAPLVRVAPSDHARSYLMRKLLGQDGISGFPMPPQGPRLAEDELRQIADWIDGGAQ